MAGNKTQATAASVDAFLDGIDPEGRRTDAHAVRTLMERITGEPAAMWGPSIVGYGSYHYVYDSGREGDMCRIGFSPRKAALTLYGMSITAQEDLLARLGKHTTGKGCLYVKVLKDVDMAVLEQLIATAWATERA